MKQLRYFSLVFLFFFYTIVNAQFPGKKNKNPYTSIDGHTYKVNEIVRVNFPSKGDNYQTVYIYKHDSALETTSKWLNVLSGNYVSKSEINLANKDINKFQGKIVYFKVLKVDGKAITYAILNYKDDYRLAIPIDLAVHLKEIISNNPDFLNKTEESNLKIAASNDLVVKSFHPNFSVKLISAIGNTQMQTVTLTYLVSHKIVHQKLCLALNNSKLFDYNGNEYNAKEAIVSNKNNEQNYSLNHGKLRCNKIPTNVPVKLIIEFNKILPSNKEFSYSESLVLFKDFDSKDYNDNSGNIEVNNIKVDWK